MITVLLILVFGVIALFSVVGGAIGLVGSSDNLSENAKIIIIIIIIAIVTIWWMLI